MNGSVDFEAAFHDAPVAVLVLTAVDHRIVLGNSAAARLLGVEAGDLVGRRLADFRERRGTSSDRQNDGSGLPGGLDGEFVCRRADGATLWLEAHSAPSGGDTGELLLVQLVDVTRRRADDARRTRREAWAAELAEIRLAVMRGASTARALELVCRSARVLLDADDAVVIIPTADGVTARVRATDGEEARLLADTVVELRSTVAGRVLAHGLPVVTTADQASGVIVEGRLPAAGAGAVLALPLRTPDVVLGALCLVRPSGRPYADDDVAVARGFADQAAAALHIGDLREARERLRVMEDRERIARDLHDSVIQDLFAAGMALDAVQPLISPDEAAERVTATVDQLDATIQQIRAAIFELEIHDPSSRVSDLVRRAVQGRSEQLGFIPTLELTGDLDDASVGVVDHVLAVISEALSNVARHAGADSTTVRVSLGTDGALRLVVQDDGGGFDPERVPRGQGLDNMHRRASLLGGRLSIARVAPGSGTRVVLETPPFDAPADVPTERSEPR